MKHENVPSSRLRVDSVGRKRRSSYSKALVQCFQQTVMGGRRKED